MNLTPEQAVALDRLFARDQQTVASNLEYEREQGTKLPDSYTRATWSDMATMRASVQVGYDCIMIKWRGMWLGIEKDGYTHS